MEASRRLGKSLVIDPDGAFGKLVRRSEYPGIQQDDEGGQG
jgi:hypothetical protein